MKRFSFKSLTASLGAALLIGLSGCAPAPAVPAQPASPAVSETATSAASSQDVSADPAAVDLSTVETQFQATLEKARGTTVHFYGWGGSDRTNAWIDGFLSQQMKQDYDITVKRVGMDVDAIQNLMNNEKQAGKEKGSIDVVWINGENFYAARQADLLSGPFTQTLPNFHKYLDTASLETTHDFGYPTEGYEAPYGKAQLVMVYNQEFMEKFPSNHQELLAFAKAHPGKLTYPAPPDFTGSAFVRNILCDIVGYESFMTMPAEEATVKKAMEPAIAYLKELAPYLWKEGRSYPADQPLLEQLYADKEIWNSMDYNPNGPQGKVDQGQFPASTRTAVFEKGTLGNTHFLAIPKNAPNPEGAKALINFVLSAKAQTDKFIPAHWGDLPVFDPAKLSSAEKQALDALKPGDSALPAEILLSHRIPEMPAKLVPIIEKIWNEEIASGKN